MSKILKFPKAYFNGNTESEVPYFIEAAEIKGWGYDSNTGTLNLLVAGNPEAAMIVVSDSNDAAAMVDQILAAKSSTNDLIEVNGLPATPDTPGNVAASSDYGQVELSWTGTAAQYNVMRSTSSGSGYALLGSTTSTSYVDNTVVTGTNYYYVIVAVNSRGSSPNSSEVNAAGLTPSTPAGLTGTAGYYSVALSWSAVSITSPAGFGVVYNIYRNGTLYTSTSDISLLDAGLTAGSNYDYTVSAAVNGVEGSQSPGTGNLTPTALSAPSSPSATAGIYSVTLSWAATTGAAAYNIYRGTSSGTEVLVQSGITGTSFTDTALDYHNAYYYKITATVNGGESPKSSEVHATPNHVTFSSASPNPASINGGVLTFTGTGFDPSQNGQIKYGTVSVNYLPVAYTNSTTISVTVPGGLTAGNIQFYYEVGGGDYQLPFTVAFS
jgi:fibronectin type 3 domain-containing protein